MNVISLPIVTADSTRSIAAGTERVGTFGYLSEPARWEWSDAVARMHGHDPGVVPTDALIRSHEHPDDEPAASAVVDQVLRHGAAVSSRHRIVDTAGREHVVVMVGDRRLEGTRVVGVTGYYVDVTEAFDVDVQKSVTETVAAVEARRALIHEAVGIIRVAYGVTAERAFEVLRWRSQETNVKLRTIAEQFVDTVVGQPSSGELRTRVGQALLAAHHVGPRPARMNRLDRRA